MPLKQCKDGDKSGWKWGDSGKCYTGPDGKKRAIKQGLAVEGPENFKKVMKSEGIYEEVLAELSPTEQVILSMQKE